MSVNNKCISQRKGYGRILKLELCKWGCYSSVSKVTGYGLDGHGSVLTDSTETLSMSKMALGHK